VNHGARRLPVGDARTRSWVLGAHETGPLCRRPSFRQCFATQRPRRRRPDELSSHVCAASCRPQCGPVPKSGNSNGFLVHCRRGRDFLSAPQNIILRLHLPLLPKRQQEESADRAVVSFLDQRDRPVWEGHVRYFKRFSTDILVRAPHGAEPPPTSSSHPMPAERRHIA